MKKLRISYLVSIILPTGAWSLLCGAFGAFLILSRANFEATGTRTIFIITFPISMSFALLLAFIEYGALRIVGIKKEREDIQILNDNIINGHLSPGLSTETIGKVFYALLERPKDALKIGYKYGALVIFFTLYIEWLASRQTINLPIIFVSGALTFLLLALFGSIFAENSIYPIVKECREILTEKEEEIKKPKFIKLRTKLNYFLLIPVLIVVAILTFLPSIDLNIIIFSGIGLAMAVIINHVISSSINKAFLELEDSAREMPKGEKVVFSTGSLNKEIVSLSKSLTRAASEIYTSRKESEKRARELEKSYQEIKKRKDELEKFYNLTIGRELKMIELKKEIKKLKEKSEKENEKVLYHN